MQLFFVMRFVQKGVHKARTLCYDKLTEQGGAPPKTRNGI